MYQYTRHIILNYTGEYCIVFFMGLVLLVFYRYTSKDEPPRVLSEEEMNRLGARIVKAELVGDMVTSLKNCHDFLQFFFKAHSDLAVLKKKKY